MVTFFSLAVSVLDYVTRNCVHRLHYGCRPVISRLGSQRQKNQVQGQPRPQSKTLSTLPPEKDTEKSYSSDDLYPLPFFLETGSYPVGLTGLELMTILLPQPQSVGNPKPM